MITAMPAVKPTTTGSGAYLIEAPERSRPSTPCLSITPKTTTKAPVGPEMLNRAPPSAEPGNPPTTAVTSPTSGVVPEAIASAMASGSATIATVRPATASALRSAAR